jgi:hypothetical protein
MVDFLQKLGAVAALIVMVGFLLSLCAAQFGLGEWFRWAGENFARRRRKAHLDREISKLKRGDIRGLARLLAGIEETKEVPYVTRQIRERKIMPDPVEGGPVT